MVLLFSTLRVSVGLYVTHLTPPSLHASLSWSGPVSSCGTSFSALVVCTPCAISAPSSARASALSFHLSPLCPFTCFHVMLSFLIACMYSCLASCISCPFFLHFHFPCTIFAAYSESHRIRMDCSCSTAHLMACCTAITSPVLFVFLAPVTGPFLASNSSPSTTTTIPHPAFPLLAEPSVYISISVSCSSVSWHSFLSFAHSILTLLFPTDTASPPSSHSSLYCFGLWCLVSVTIRCTRFCALW